MLSAPRLSPSRHIHRTVLPNGMVVLVLENNTADIIASRIFVRTGGRYETSDQAGLSHLLMSLITKGTQRLSSLEIAEWVESMGASLGADSATDYCLMSLKTVSQDFPNILGLAAELLRSPSFPESEVELERRLTLQGIRSTQEQPFSIAQQQLRRAMYGSHPYGRTSLGTEETVARLTRDDLLQFHGTYFRPDNMVISLAGRITPEAAIALVEETFGDWPVPQDENGSVSLPVLDIPSVLPAPQRVATAQDTQQAIVMLGYLAAPLHSQDYATLKLINTYLGSGLSSRLFVELREKLGLAYEVSTFYPTRMDTSQFVAYMGTAPGNAAIALDGLKREVDRLTTTRLTDDELQSAKNKFLGQYALGKQTNAQLAQVQGWYEILGMGLDFDQAFQDAIAVVTAEMVQETAQQYFGNPYFSLVGPAAAIQP
ncbi:M16 family metallopeptidase [Leptolyngbya sp. AN02str]|uniref:M16 family metallopeptidase n=1 Tax=Leptolyngbya sp. AN02str TaxID=3423363 RepID=UPI003D319776